MGSVTIKPKGPFAGPTDLQATPSADSTGLQWAASTDGTTFTDVAGETRTTFSLDPVARLNQKIRVTATFTDGTTATDVLTVTAKPKAEQPPADDGDVAPAEPPAVWHAGFAVASGVVALALLVLFIVATSVRQAGLGLSPTAYAKLDGRGLVGAAVIGPIILVGVTVTLVGCWMVIVEWRGRFEPEEKPVDGGPKAKGAAEIGTVVTALSKLRGATLVLLSGVAILLSVAWMTSSTAGAEPATPPGSTSSATPTATTTG